MAIVTPTDRPKSVRNRCVIEVFCVVFVFSSCFLDCSVSVGAFVIGLSQISSFFIQYEMHKEADARAIHFIFNFFQINIITTIKPKNISLKIISYPP